MVCFILSKLYLIFLLRSNRMDINGKIVAITKDQNNKAVETQFGNKSILNQKPTKILFSKDMLGKNNKPPISPTTVDTTVFVSSISFLTFHKNWNYCCTHTNLQVKTYTKHLNLWMLHKKLIQTTTPKLFLKDLHKI